jgi:hypothetical protein
VRPARKADNFTAICEPTVLDYAESITSHKPIDLHGLLRGWVFIFGGDSADCEGEKLG